LAQIELDQADPTFFVKKVKTISTLLLLLLLELLKSPVGFTIIYRHFEMQFFFFSKKKFTKKIKWCLNSI
jgi:hypothetical protein